MVARLIERYFAELAYLSRSVNADAIVEFVEHLLAARARDANVFLVGNGGSAATASHFANDLLKSDRGVDGRRLRALALTDATPILTAVANDLDYERVFSEQLAVHARPGDVLVAISGSGNSPNVLRCVELARSVGLTTIGLVGFGGGRVASMVDLAIVVPGSRIQVVEDTHSAICHATSVAIADVLAGERETARPAIFVDRDGVLNTRRDDHVRSLQEFDLLPDALPSLRELGGFGAPVIVVTNQSVIGRGLASISEVERIHDHLQRAVLSADGPNLSIYVCPHAPDESCDCRKPRPGLLVRAAVDLGLDLQQSVFIGDSMADVAAALSVGCYPILVGARRSATAVWPPGMVGSAASLADAVAIVRARPEFAALAAKGGGSNRTTLLA